MLREKNTELHNENAALRRTASKAIAANEGAQHHAQQVDSPPKSRPVPTGSPVIKAQRVSSQKEKQHVEDVAEKAGLGSPIEVGLLLRCTLFLPSARCGDGNNNWMHQVGPAEQPHVGLCAGPGRG